MDKIDLAIAKAAVFAGEQAVLERNVPDHLLAETVRQTVEEEFYKALAITPKAVRKA